MNREIASKLLDINRQFYQMFAVHFSATRGRLQSAVRRIMEGLPSTANLLDLGCGNGELARQLSRRGHTGRYLGVDFSPELLFVRQEHPLPPNFLFLAADLAALDWVTHPEVGAAQFDFALAFAVLHHLPGEALRRQVLCQVHDLLSPGGRFIHSNWQFLNSPRLSARIQPWETIGLAGVDADAGDYLLDWRSGGLGLRYVHHFSEDELASLAEETGFRVIEMFYSDGKGGRLGLYEVWEPCPK